MCRWSASDLYRFKSTVPDIFSAEPEFSRRDPEAR